MATLKFPNARVLAVGRIGTTWQRWLFDCFSTETSQRIVNKNMARRTYAQMAKKSAIMLPTR